MARRIHKRAGRPPGPRHLVRSIELRVRLNRAELKTLQRKAATFGLTLSALTRLLLLGAARPAFTSRRKSRRPPRRARRRPARDI